MNWSRFRNPAFLAALGVLGVSAIGFNRAISGLHLTKEPIQAPESRKLDSIPREYAHWKQVGRDEEMSAEAIEELGTANSISRVYVETEPPEGRPPRQVQVHIAYYTGKIDTVPHVPERCMVGAGWTKGGATLQVPVPLTIEGRMTTEMGLDPKKHGTSKVYRGLATDPPGRVRLPRDIESLELSVTPFSHAGGQTLYAGYFFIANGGVVASANQVRLLAFKLEEKYAFYCKVQFSTADVASAQELGEVAGAILDDMLPDIMRRVPDWVEVVEGRYPAKADGKRGA
jgi:hypothetical protein